MANELLKVHAKLEFLLKMFLSKQQIKKFNVGGGV